MSASLRDERWRVYSYADAVSDGRADPKYNGIGTWWARSASPSGREATLFGKANQQIDIVLNFSKEAVIPTTGFLRGPDDKTYRILQVLPVRGTGGEPEQQVIGVFSEDVTEQIVENPTNQVTRTGTAVRFGGQPLTFEAA